MVSVMVLVLCVFSSALVNFYLLPFCLPVAWRRGYSKLHLQSGTPMAPHQVITPHATTLPDNPVLSVKTSLLGLLPFILPSTVWLFLTSCLPPAVTTCLQSFLTQKLVFSVHWLVFSFLYIKRFYFHHSSASDSAIVVLI